MKKSVVCRKNLWSLWSYCLNLLVRSNNSERILFSSRDQSECKTFCKIADADSFVRGETLDIFPNNLDDLDHLFEEEMDNIRQKVISYTAQKMKFSMKDFFSKCDQIRSFLRIWSHLLKKILNGKLHFLYSVIDMI